MTFGNNSSNNRQNTGYNTSRTTNQNIFSNVNSTNPFSGLPQEMLTALSRLLTLLVMLYVYFSL